MNGKCIALILCISGTIAIRSLAAVEYISIDAYAATPNSHVTIEENGDTKYYTFSGNITGSKSQRIDLRGFDFSNITIDSDQPITFSYVDFSGAIFPPLMTIENVKFVRCQFVGAIFIMSSLDDVIFQYCNLQDAIFNYGIITDTIFDTCILKTAHVTPAEISNTIFSMSNMENINLSDTTLTNVVFTDLSTLKGAFFVNLTAESNNVYFGILPPLKSLPLLKAKEHCKITPEGVLGSVDLTMANFTGAQGKKIMFTGDDDVGITMTNTILNNTSFGNSDFDNICVAKADEETCENFENIDELRSFIASGGAD